MVGCRLHWALPRAMVIILPIFVASSFGTMAIAADSTRSLYDWERPAEKQESQKPFAPIRKPTTSAASPSEQPQWRKPAIRPQGEAGIDRRSEGQPGKSSTPNPTGAEALRSQASSAVGPVVVGRVVYRGPVSSPTPMEVTRDSEVCGQVINIAPLSVDPVSHGVRNAIVHANIGREMTDDVPIHVSVVGNKRCEFYPRVAALRAGTETEISNDDPVMHNTNMTLNNRTVLNVALVAGGTPIRKPLKKEGLHLIKCNVHRFMQAYRYVFGDPFFDQTNETGQFRIVGLPPGLHAVSVWHETLGVLHTEVRVPVQGTVTLDLEFK